ncbi:VOC family protein [Variovorax sp. DAIF25]|uniref:VOC family protein n=1 Tax=Variovorax sp. DAIF25 TaxID=3080983 RepID=UPI003D6C0A93
MNPVSYFEIPVLDMDRAIRFYEAVFGHALERASVDGNEMAFFAHAPGREGASGALAKGDSYRPSRDGARLYFDVPDIEAVLARALAQGAELLYPVTGVGSFGFVAEFADCEGNCIALHAQAR